MAQDYHCIAIWHDKKWRREGGKKGKRIQEEQSQIWEKAMALVPSNGPIPRENPEAEEETGAWKCG